METETKNTNFTAAIASKAVWAKLPRGGKVTPVYGTYNISLPITNP